MLATPGYAAFPGKNGKIAFAQYESVGHGPGSPSVGTIESDGTGWTVLASDHNSFKPAWSPDGTRIAFTNASRYDPSSPEYCRWSYCGHIYVMNADGSGLTRISNSNGGDWDPAWSPDGTRLAFSSGRGGNLDIYSMNADGGDVTQLTSNPSSDTSPAWSPRGDQIAFQRSSSTFPFLDIRATGQIFTMGVDGSGERLTIGAASRNPNWSPDGRRIAWDDGEEVFVSDADGTNGLILTTEVLVPDPDTGFVGLSWNVDPAWSPDGSKIMFGHGGCGWGYCFEGGLETVNPDGTGRAVFFGTGTEPDWQPIPNQPPDCSGVTATPSSLPHHRFHTVTLAGATDPDGDAVTITITGVTQDEPVGRRPDARAGESTDQVQLRGRRLPRGDGRVYRIAFTASDGSDECSGVATVEVRRHKKQPTVDSAPPSYDSFAQ